MQLVQWYSINWQVINIQLKVVEMIKANERKTDSKLWRKIQVVANKYLDALVRLGVKSQSDKPKLKSIGNKRVSELNIAYIVLVIIYLILAFPMFKHRNIILVL
jgi:hypothetical protein